VQNPLLLTRWRYRSGRCRDITLGSRRRLHCDWREVTLCGLLSEWHIHDVVGLIILLASQVGKAEAGHEEHSSEDRRGARQEGGRTASAENRTRSAAGTKACTGIRSASLLQHDQSDDREGDQDMYDH